MAHNNGSRDLTAVAQSDRQNNTLLYIKKIPLKYVALMEMTSYYVSSTIHLTMIREIQLYSIVIMIPSASRDRDVPIVVFFSIKYQTN